MLESKLRNRTFVGIMLSLIAFLVPFELFDLWDSAVMLYCLCTLFITGCLVIWGYWWWESKTHSDMFAMVGLLLAAIAINMVFQVYARWQFIYGRCIYEGLLRSDWWAYRIALELVVLIWFFSWSIGRFFGERSCISGDPDCHNGIRRDMVAGFDRIDAEIVAGELRFLEHSHEGLVLGAKLIIKTPQTGGDK